MKRKANKYLVIYAGGIFTHFGLGSTLSQAMKKARAPKNADFRQLRIYTIRYTNRPLRDWPLAPRNGVTMVEIHRNGREV